MNSRKKGRYTKKLRKTQRSRKYSRKSYNRIKNKKSRRNIKKTRKRSYTKNKGGGKNCAIGDVSAYANIDHIEDTSSLVRYSALYWIIDNSHLFTRSGFYTIRFNNFERLLNALHTNVDVVSTEKPEILDLYKGFRENLTSLMDTTNYVYKSTQKDDLCEKRYKFIDTLFTYIITFLVGMENITGHEDTGASGPTRASGRGLGSGQTRSSGRGLGSSLEIQAPPTYSRTESNFQQTRGLVMDELSKYGNIDATL